MLYYSLIGAVLIVATVAIHAIGTLYWVRHLSHRFIFGKRPLDTHKSLLILSNTGLIMVMLHVIQIVLWALTYLALVPEGELDSLEEAIYFSFVTFTTLGYGDITLSEGVRLASGIEAMNGILLVGWSTAVLFAVVQKIWQSNVKASNNN